MPNNTGYTENINIRLMLLYIRVSCRCSL